MKIILILFLYLTMTHLYGGRIVRAGLLKWRCADGSRVAESMGWERQKLQVRMMKANEKEFWVERMKVFSCRL